MVLKNATWVHWSHGARPQAVVHSVPLQKHLLSCLGDPTRDSGLRTGLQATPPSAGTLYPWGRPSPYRLLAGLRFLPPMGPPSRCLFSWRWGLLVSPTHLAGELRMTAAPRLRPLPRAADAQPECCHGALHAAYWPPPFPRTSLLRGPPALALSTPRLSSLPWTGKQRKSRCEDTESSQQSPHLCPAVGPVAVLSSPTSSGLHLQTCSWRRRAGSLAGRAVLLLGLLACPSEPSGRFCCT